MGHGGTLDPFATGLLVVCVGPRRETFALLPGFRQRLRSHASLRRNDDSGRSDRRNLGTMRDVPSSLEELQVDGGSIFRASLICKRRRCTRRRRKTENRSTSSRAKESKSSASRSSAIFTIFVSPSTGAPRRGFSVSCSSGTYIRTLAQDFARLFGTVGMLTTPPSHALRSLPGRTSDECR